MIEREETIADTKKVQVTNPLIKRHWTVEPQRAQRKEKGREGRREREPTRSNRNIKKKGDAEGNPSSNNSYTISLLVARSQKTASCSKCSQDVIVISYSHGAPQTPQSLISKSGSWRTCMHSRNSAFRKNLFKREGGPKVD